MKLLLPVILGLILLPFVRAAPLETSISLHNTTVVSGTYIPFNLTVANNAPVERQFQFKQLGDAPWWKQDGAIFFTVPANTTITMHVGFFPVGAKDGQYPFTLRIQAYDDPSVFADQLFTITIRQPIVLETFTAVRTDGAVKISVPVDVYNSRELIVQYDIVGPNGQVIATASDKAQVSGKRMFEKIIPFPLSPPGTYTVRVNVNGQKGSATFDQPEVRTVERRTQTIVSAWYDEVVVTATNTGNAQTVYQVEEVYPSATPISVSANVIAPSVTQNEGKAKYVYSLGLQPGQTQEVRYKVEKWPIYLQLAIAVLAIAAVGIPTSKKYTRPRIRKKYRRGKAMTSIVLSVKNSFSPAAGAVVRDWVSPQAAVVNDEFEAIKPIVRRSDAGTELVWSLGNLHPGEERYISYKVKPARQGAHLKFGRASLRFKNKQGTLQRVLSNALEVA